MSAELKPTPSFWSRLGRVIVNILRFLLILMLIAGVAAAIYFGAPYLYEKFILPVETNTARLNEIENKQAADVDQLTVQIADLKTRLADLETRQTASSLAIGETQGQVAALETAVQSHGETLNQLADLQATLDTLSATAAKHESLLVGENSALADVQSTLDTLSATTAKYESLLEGENSALADLQAQVTLSRVVELLSRSRLYLYESNFGLAQQDVQAARDLLQKLQDDMPADKIANLQEVITRLDLALGNLPDFPVIAADDVDIAWQLLVYGLSNLPTPTFTPAPVTETPAPTEEVTPTITP